MTHDEEEMIFDIWLRRADHEVGAAVVASLDIEDMLGQVKQRAAHACGVIRKRDLLDEAEQIAKGATRWKMAGDRMREILDEWIAIKGIDRETDEVLGKRFTQARETFNRRRQSHLHQGRAAAVIADAMTFRILGPMEVRGTSGTIRIPPGRQQVILASLLMEANQLVTMDHLVDALWEDDPPSTARTQVQICVSRLRKSLTSAGVDTPILSQPPGYLLRVDESQLDIQAFTNKLTKARALAREGRQADTAALLRSAAALWRGPCLAGIPHRALRTWALRLEEDRLDAIETYMELELGLGLHHQLVGELTRLVHEHPLRERLRGLLMRALYLAGRQAEALAVYRAGRDMLIDEMGLEPGDELRSLENAILAGDTSSLLRSTPRELAEAAHAVPKPVAQRPRPRQLPADTADFTGNEELIATAESVLVGDGQRHAVGVVVIAGKPGVGKSTLATHIGHRVADDHFPDGQLYCDLRGIRGGADGVADVLGRFLLALGIPGTMIPEELDERVELYRTLLANRRVLVVLDDAVTEQQVTPLLPGSSSCAVIITTRSRRLTAVPGARGLELDELDPAQSLELIGHVIGAERVESEPEAAAALVKAVGGLPLALRIIGARLAAKPHWTLASMVHRLANERRRLDELVHGDMTIRASLSLTHDDLDRQSRRLFGLLSMADGLTLPGWTAGAVLDDDSPSPSDLLEPLVDVQLLDVTAVEHTGEFRYRYQDMVRLFAREQLPAEADAVTQHAALARMLGGWLAIAEQAHRQVYGGDFTVLHGSAPRWQPPPKYVEQVLVEPLEWLDGEHANLCAAVTQAAMAGLAELSWDLAVTLVTLFEARGYLDDWERTHQDALMATQLAGNVRGTAALLSSLGTLYIQRGQHSRSRSVLIEALAMFEELDDAHGLALCQRDLALLDRQAGDDDSAFARYAVALREFDRVDDPVGRAIALTQSAPILYRRGKVAEAHTRLAEAIDIYQTVGYTDGIPHALRRIGQLHLMSGEFETTAATMTEVLTMVRHSRDVIGEGYALVSLGEVNAAAGRPAQARVFFQQALTLREQIADHSGAAVVRLELARTLRSLGEQSQAAELLAQAIATFDERGMDRERQAAEQEAAIAAERVSK
jgi:DNA-binding SARP family transcriptional activator/tetratricopeptide (TPR) repeat protein